MLVGPVPVPFVALRLSEWLAPSFAAAANTWDGSSAASLAAALVGLAAGAFPAGLFLVYGLVLAALFAYGLNFFHLAWTGCRLRDSSGPTPPRPGPPAPDVPSELETDGERLPFVTVQLPIYNERYVARRLIDAVAALDWPRDRFEIQVLDDSTDVTRDVAASAVAEWSRRGVRIQHLTRPNRAGFKAGALAAGLEEASGEYLAVFDADFVPAPDFLRLTLPHFTREPGLGFLQARWGHMNRFDSALTRLQALSIDGHFGLEQFARHRSGYLMNFNGTAGVWRAAAIRAAGGWSADTLTEDLDLSYRAQLAGYSPGYLRDVVVPAEIPGRIDAYRRQQYRWARGSTECVVKLLPQVLAARMPLQRKVQAAFHLTGYGIHFLMAMLALVYPFVVVQSAGRPDLVALFGLASVFNITALAPTVFYLTAQRELGHDWRRRAPAVLALSVLGAGMMVNSLSAILAGLAGRAAEFERTPKTGGAPASGRQAYRSRGTRVVGLEIAFLAWNLNTVRLAVAGGNWIIAFYAGVFALGLTYVLTLTALDGLRDRRLQPLPSIPRPAFSKGETPCKP